jgi:hypothetical protein
MKGAPPRSDDIAIHRFPPDDRADFTKVRGLTAQS